MQTKLQNLKKDKDTSSFCKLSALTNSTNATVVYSHYYH